jgi:hypothetical protein
MFARFFSSDEEEYRVLLPFIKDGFQFGDKALHVVNPEQRQDHLRRLAAVGIDMVAAQRNGQFELRTNTEMYLRDGRFDRNRMLDVSSSWQAVAEKGDSRSAASFATWTGWLNADRTCTRSLSSIARNDVRSRHDDAVICT